MKPIRETNMQQQDKPHQQMKKKFSLKRYSSKLKQAVTFLSTLFKQTNKTKPTTNSTQRNPSATNNILKVLSALLFTSSKSSAEANNHTNNIPSKTATEILALKSAQPTGKRSRYISPQERLAMLEEIKFINRKFPYFPLEKRILFPIGEFYSPIVFAKYPYLFIKDIPTMPWFIVEKPKWLAIEDVKVEVKYDNMHNEGINVVQAQKTTYFGTLKVLYPKSFKYIFREVNAVLPLNTNKWLAIEDVKEETNVQIVETTYLYKLISTNELELKSELFPKIEYVQDEVCSFIETLIYIMLLVFKRVGWQVITLFVTKQVEPLLYVLLLVFRCFCLGIMKFLTEPALRTAQNNIYLLPNCKSDDNVPWKMKSTLLLLKDMDRSDEKDEVGHAIHPAVKVDASGSTEKRRRFTLRRNRYKKKISPFGNEYKGKDPELTE